MIGIRITQVVTSREEKHMGYVRPVLRVFELLSIQNWHSKTLLDPNSFYTKKA